MSEDDPYVYPTYVVFQRSLSEEEKEVVPFSPITRDSFEQLVGIEPKIGAGYSYDEYCSLKERQHLEEERNRITRNVIQGEVYIKTKADAIRYFSPLFKSDPNFKLLGQFRYLFDINLLK